MKEGEHNSAAILIAAGEQILSRLLPVFNAYGLSASGTGTAAHASQMISLIQPNLILVDLDATGGFALLESIRTNTSCSSIVAATNSDQAAAKARLLGVGNVIVKNDMATVVDATLFFLRDRIRPKCQPNGIRVLLVDDEYDEREILADFLAFLGYTVAVASSGPDALQLVKQGFQLSVVVLDLFPKGIGGLETLKELMNTKSHPAVIMTGAAADQEIARHARKLGAFDYLLKPLQPEALEVSIAACAGLATDQGKFAKRCSRFLCHAFR